MTRVFIFASSLAPLVAIIAFRLSEAHAELAIVLGLIGLVSIMSLPVALRARRGISAQPLTVRAITDDSSQIPSYLLTYIFPFVTADADGWRDIVSYSIFGALVLVLLLRTNLSLVNPLLLAAGYRLFSIESTHGQKLVLIARKSIQEHDNLLITSLSASTFKLVKTIP